MNQIIREAESSGLRRSLGPVQLVLLGVGCIVGAGIYVMTGTAAANYAGPAVILSFGMAGFACAMTGLCYAELSSALPVSGSSYTYAYAAIGEVVAWALGWLLMLEYTLAGSALAVGLSGYLSSLINEFGIIIPQALRTPYLHSNGVPGGTRLIVGGGINLVAVACLAAAAAVLVRDVGHSAIVNAILVVIKLVVLLLFVAVGSAYVDRANWQPFVPPNEGGFTYGAAGVLRAASLLFFAYLGFETVSTAASEARNPQRDMPIGILGALAICTTLYIAVAWVLTGLVPFRSLGVPDPIALAIEKTGLPALSIVVKTGAVIGLASVLLVNTYGHSRICFAMSRDGLLPALFSRIHPRFSTPCHGTIIVASAAGVAAALLPIGILADLVSIGTASAFSIVAISVMWLRTTQPGLERPFRVPLGGLWIRGAWIGTVPVLALSLCLLMVGPVLADIAIRAFRGDAIPLIILLVYLIAGVVIYRVYCCKHSKIQILGQIASSPSDNRTIDAR